MRQWTWLFQIELWQSSQVTVLVCWKVAESGVIMVLTPVVEWGVALV